jgi:hypothetical protein
MSHKEGGLTLGIPLGISFLDKRHRVGTAPFGLTIP